MPEKKPKKKKGITFAETQESTDSAASSVLEMLPFKRPFLWKDLLIYPSKTIEKEKGKATILQGVIDSASMEALVTFLTALIVGSFYAVAGTAMTLFFVLAGAGASFSADVLVSLLLVLLVVALFAILLLVFIVFLSVVLSVIGLLLWSAVDYGVARLLGGTGSFEQQTYFNGVITAGILMASLPLMLLSFLPCMGYFFSALSFIVSIYSFYLRYRVFSQVHELEAGKAVACTLVPLVVQLGLIAVGLALFFGVWLLSFFAAAL